MKEVDYERARAAVMGLGRTMERPWSMLDFEERTEPLPDKALSTIIGAREARPLAESHRGFSVGACALIRRRGEAIAISHGVNMKSSSGRSVVDLHAEETILNSLRPRDEVTVLTIIGPPQEDHGSGRQALTLHPCTYRCQPMLAESPHVGVDTLILCNTPDGTKLEWGTVADFQRYHRGEPADITSASFETTPSVLFPVPRAEAYDLADPALDIDTTEWDAKVTFPLVEWALQRR